MGASEGHVYTSLKSQGPVLVGLPFFNHTLIPEVKERPPCAFWLSADSLTRCLAPDVQLCSATVMLGLDLDRESELRIQLRERTFLPSIARICLILQSSSYAT